MTNKVTSMSLLLVIVFAGHHLVAQQLEEDSTSDPQNNPESLFISILGQLAIPQQDFKDHASIIGGFRIEAGKKFRQESAFKGGLALNALFAGTKEDNFKGMNLKTQSSLLEIHPFLRVSPVKKTVTVKPYLDLSAGLMVNVTQSTTEIIDRPTFLEQVLFNKDEEVETVNHKDHASANLSFGIGAGITIKNVILIGARYNHSNSIRYVDKNKVFVADGAIHYEAKEVPLDMIVISAGFTF